MKKRIILLLVSMLFLFFVLKYQSFNNYSTATPYLQISDEHTTSLSNQEKAQSAYERIYSACKTNEEFGNAYYGDGYLIVCLTDTSEEIQEKYLNLVDTPSIVQFKKVTYSYRELLALRTAIEKITQLKYSTIGINIKANKVEIGVPDIATSAEQLSIISHELPKQVAMRFTSYPIMFVESSYVQLD